MIYIATDGSCTDYKKRDNLLAGFSTVISSNDKINKIIYGIVPNKPMILNINNNIYSISSDKNASDIETSHNRGELLGVIMGIIHIISHNSYTSNEQITFICDSKYTINMITKWMFNDKEYKNPDLLNILKQIYPLIKDKTTFIHQPAHTKDTKGSICTNFEYLNKEADTYAKLAISENDGRSYKVILY